MDQDNVNRRARGEVEGEGRLLGVCTARSALGAPRSLVPQPVICFVLARSIF
jgi:hypothetical protein